MLLSPLRSLRPNGLEPSKVLDWDTRIDLLHRLIEEYLDEVVRVGILWHQKWFSRVSPDLLLRAVLHLKLVLCLVLVHPDLIVVQSDCAIS